jgi:hypothetical protein
LVGTKEPVELELAEDVAVADPVVVTVVADDDTWTGTLLVEALSGGRSLVEAPPGGRSLVEAPPGGRSLVEAPLLELAEDTAAGAMGEAVAGALLVGMEEPYTASTLASVMSSLVVQVGLSNLG